MSSYYTYISQSIKLTAPVWSQPYNDFNTGKRMVTVSMPIYDELSPTTKLFGVAGIDVLMEKLSTSFGLS